MLNVLTFFIDIFVSWEIIKILCFCLLLFCSHYITNIHLALKRNELFWWKYVGKVSYPGYKCVISGIVLLSFLEMDLFQDNVVCLYRASLVSTDWCNSFCRIILWSDSITNVYFSTKRNNPLRRKYIRRRFIICFENQQTTI